VVERVLPPLAARRVHWSPEAANNGAKTMTRWTGNDLPDLTGRTVVITGAGRGLGLITARELARAGARVVLGVRDTGKARSAVAGLPGVFDIRPLDVAAPGPATSTF
jgi:NADPH:quinone reductase-like Zn-dependent oxidoreductase